MTCVAAIGNRETGVSHIAADSYFSSGLNYIGQQSKIWKKEQAGEIWLMGVAGKGRYAQVMQYGVEAIEAPLPKENADIQEFLFRKWVPLLRTAVKSAGAFLIKDGQEFTDSVMLLAIRGCLFSMDSFYCLTEQADSYMAIGSGGEIGLGVLWNQEHTNSKLSPKNRLSHTVEAASKYCRGVGGRFDFLSSESE